MINFKNQMITIIHQISASELDLTKISFDKYIIKNCCVRENLTDKSSGYIVNNRNSFTVYAPIDDYVSPKEITYSAPPYKWTVNIGDIVIIGEVAETAPTTINEFNDLRTNYKNKGGVVTDVEEFLYYKNSKPCKTSHIQIIKG